MPDIASSILGLRGWAAVAVVFALPALESSAFVGFIFPGEIAVILGGVLAYNHRVNLALITVAAVVGAVVGDTIGYSVGRRWGNRLLEGPLSRFISHDKAERGKQFLLKRGGRAVFFGRFTAALRVMVPGLAGMSGVPYARFAISNVLGGTLWAVAFTLLGYAAGASWREVERTARNAGLLLLGVLIVVAAVVGVARWVAHHPDPVRARLARIGRLPGVRWFLRRFEGQLTWLGARVRPSEVLGLSLTLAFAATLLFGTGFALLGSSFAGPGTQRRLDQPVLDWLVQHRSPEFTAAMKAVTALGSTYFLVPLIAVAGLAWWRLGPSPSGPAPAPAAASRRGRLRAGGLRAGGLRPMLLLAVSAAGAWALSSVMKEVVGRARPPVSVHLVSVSALSYPSGHATQSMALYGCAAALIAAWARAWSAKVAAWAVASLLIAAIGFSRLYLGVHWLTDVLGGYALGAVWLGLVLMVTRVTESVGSRSRRGGDDSAGGDVLLEGGASDPPPLVEVAGTPPI